MGEAPGGEGPGGAALLRLQAALSPAFPVGGFSFSHGLERAVHDRLVTDASTLGDWLDLLLTQGSLWNDALLLAAAWRAGAGEEADVNELGLALAGSRERATETTHQGNAFRAALPPAWGLSSDEGDTPYPVAVGRFAGRLNVALEPLLAMHLQAALTNLIQAAIRLAPIGQAAGLRALAALEPALLDTAARAATATLDDLGSAAFLSEISALRHETQYSRIFRS